MKLSCFLAIIVTIAGCPTLFSQSSDAVSALPSGRLVTAPEANASWTLKFDYSKSSKKKSSNQLNIPEATKVLKMDFFSSPEVRIIETKFQNGNKDTVYFVGDQRVIKFADRAELYVFGPEENLRTEYALPREYPGFNWVSRETFQGVVTYKDKTCYKFSRAPVKWEPTAGRVAPTGRRAETITEAYVDLKTLLPVAYLEGDTLVEYQHENRPGTNTIPAEVKKAIDQKAGYRTR